MAKKLVIRYVLSTQALFIGIVPVTHWQMEFTQTLSGGQGTAGQVAKRKKMSLSVYERKKLLNVIVNSLLRITPQYTITQQINSNTPGVVVVLVGLVVETVGPLVELVMGGVVAFPGVD